MNVHSQYVAAAICRRRWVTNIDIYGCKVLFLLNSLYLEWTRNSKPNPTRRWRYTTFDFIVDFREDIGLYKLLCRSAWYDKGVHLATRGTLLYKNISKHAHVKPSHISIHSEAQNYLYRSLCLPIRTFARLTVCFNCVGLMSANRASEHLF